MRLIIVLIMILCLWVCTVPFSHTEEPAKSTDSTKIQIPAGGQPKTSVVAAEEPDFAETLESLHQMTKTAQVAAKTIGRTLGQYVREKYNQQKQIEILSRFNAALEVQLAPLSLTPPERSLLVSKIEEAYIRDSETGTNQLDQNYFHDLSYVVKKEYADIQLSKTQEGTVQTYDYDGNLKTKWILKNGKPEGSAITYYSSGEIKFIDLYENGERISRKKYDEEGKLIFEQDYSYQKKSEPEPVRVEAPTKKEEAAVQASAPATSELKQSEGASERLSQPSESAGPKKADTVNPDSFVVPVNYYKGEGEPPVPQVKPLAESAGQLNPKDNRIEVIFKETRTQTVQNETHGASNAGVGTQTKALLGS